MKFFLFFFILFFNCIVSAQTNSITGAVIDADSKAVVGGCNVFISKTSNGVTINAAGKFSLYNIPGGSLSADKLTEEGFEVKKWNVQSFLIQ